MFDWSAARSSDQKTCSAADQPADLAPAFRAFRKQAIRNGLSPFEPQPAGVAFIFIGRHRSSHSFSCRFRKHDHVVFVVAKASRKLEPSCGKKRRRRLQRHAADEMLPPPLLMHPGDKFESFR